MLSEFTFGDNSDKSSFFLKLLMNLVDRDLTEHQITQLLTLSRLHATSGADKGNLTVHTRNMLTGADKGIRLFNQTSYPSFVVFRSMQCEPCESVE